MPVFDRIGLGAWILLMVYIAYQIRDRLWDFLVAAFLAILVVSIAGTLCYLIGCLLMGPL